MGCRRQRGRPRKNAISPSSPKATVPRPRGRGRPPKSSYSNASSLVANVPRTRGRGRPPKRPDNPSLESFLPQPVTKKPRTKVGYSVTVLKEGATLYAPHLVNALERTHMPAQDDIKPEELARWNNERKRNERKENGSLTLILRHRKSGSRALILSHQKSFLDLGCGT
ncbi:uncharacterized protein LOC130784787 [Actinidia eriantha]|uniref:uncharacterized protein LOC130784787 n=1 Tax=Actinidia eriantha TaxID=165200 RepID=UPI00258F6278|nr:uncharacterized protein LOC130784787 [Actinidia eriantha]